MHYRADTSRIFTPASTRSVNVWFEFSGRASLTLNIISELPRRTDCPRPAALARLSLDGD